MAVYKMSWKYFFQAESITAKLKVFAPSWKYLRQAGSICAKLELFTPSWNYLRQVGTICDRLKLLVPSWENFSQPHFSHLPSSINHLPSHFDQPPLPPDQVMQLFDILPCLTFKLPLQPDETNYPLYPHPYFLIPLFPYFRFHISHFTFRIVCTNRQLQQLH